MNSWKSSSFEACTPPLSTLKCGTGSDGAPPSGASHCHSGMPADAASARASAMETPTVALAPSLLLFGVPSKVIIAWSTSASEFQDVSRSRSAISPLTFAVALSTPRPSYRSLSPSRSSTASRDPVDAPDGTPARALVPSPSVTLTASVGRARESRISSADNSVTSNNAIAFSLRSAESAPVTPWRGRVVWPSNCLGPLLLVPGELGCRLGAAITALRTPQIP